MHCETVQQFLLPLHWIQHGEWFYIWLIFSRLMWSLVTLMDQDQGRSGQPFDFAHVEEQDMPHWSQYAISCHWRGIIWWYWDSMISNLEVVHIFLECRWQELLVLWRFCSMLDSWKGHRLGCHKVMLPRWTGQFLLLSWGVSWMSHLEYFVDHVDQRSE